MTTEIVTHPENKEKSLVLYDGKVIGLLRESVPFDRNPPNATTEQIGLSYVDISSDNQNVRHYYEPMQDTEGKRLLRLIRSTK